MLMLLTFRLMRVSSLIWLLKLLIGVRCRGTNEIATKELICARHDDAQQHSDVW